MENIQKIDDQQNGIVVNSDGSSFQWNTYYLREWLELKNCRFESAELVKYADGTFHLHVNFMHCPTAQACTWRFWSRDEATPADANLLGPVENAKIRFGIFTPAGAAEDEIKSSWKWVEVDGRKLSGGKRVYTPKEEGEGE